MTKLQSLNRVFHYHIESKAGKCTLIYSHKDDKLLKVHQKFIGVCSSLTEILAASWLC